MESTAISVDTPVQLIVNAMWCIYLCRYHQDDLLKFELTIEMGKRGDVRYFEHGMDGLSISEQKLK